MRCYVCFEEILPEVTWSTFLLPQKVKKICYGCERQFEHIVPACPKCGRPDSTGLCFDCERWGMEQEDPLEQNVALYQYNDFAKDWVARWKYRGDYELLQSLECQLRSLFQKTEWDTYALVPVPLSGGRLVERGFNQSEAIIQSLGQKSTNLLRRTGTEKQSKKQRRARVASSNPFSMIDPIYTPVVLVDDIYTTGTTIRHAASLLKQSGCPQVFSLTLFR
ncbi:ComF family protein [Halobacillus locisalis]|uniref:ComF family protein n=1 Tax=Halobacillus locisalis TaxID=220753 RepID=A0A838CU07_9BACI|nr:ComF family protein [Halobacillus locisalis]MBA2175557.1 ComF family protein [Halobacillus locisalis]